MPTYQYSNTPLYVSEGQTVQFRYEAPANFDTVEQVIIQIGDSTSFWVIETIPEDTAPDPYILRQINPADIHDPDNGNPAVYTYAETSAGPDAAPVGGGGLPTPLRNGEEVITVNGLSDTVSVNLIISSNGLDQTEWAWRVRNWNGSSYDAWPAFTTGNNFPNPVPTVKNNDQVQVRVASSKFPADTRRLTVTIGSGSEDWEIITGSAPINTPNPVPVFNGLNNLNLQDVVYSNIVQISGLTATTADVSIVPTTGSFAIANSNATTTNADNFDVLTGATFANTGAVSNGQYLQLKGTASNTPNTPVNYSISIGSGSDIAGWEIRTGQGIDETPNNFIFTDLVEQVPGTQNILSEVETISGLTPGLTVPLTIRGTDPPEANPRIKVNSGSTANISNIFVGNGDTIQLVMNAHPELPVAPETRTSYVGINVGNLQISNWNISNWYGPDDTPTFVVPSDAVNQTPGGTGVLGPILLSGYNVPITASITTPIAYDAGGNPTGEVINPIRMSVNGGPILNLPATIPNDPSGNPVSIMFFTDQPGNAEVDPVQGLSHYLEWDITFGTAASFTVKSINYAVKPIPPAFIGKWYTNKNEFFDEVAYQAAGSPVANATDYYTATKFDGLALGTVVPVTKENISGYGDLEARYPGFLECNGQQVNAADYPFLWEVIKNTYGGDGAYNEVSKAYTGTFNVPDYRNKRMAGKGIVDATRGASSFLEATNAGGSYDIVGSTGGYWYVSDVGVAGPDPLEQVTTTAGANVGTESEFYVLGTPRTFGTETTSAEVEFSVTGLVTATIGPVRDVRVTVPPHEHYYITGQPEQFNGDPVIPWNTPALYKTGQSGGGNSGEISDEPSSDAVYSIWQGGTVNFGGNNTAAEFDTQIGLTDGGNLRDILPLGPEGSSTQATFGNYWASPTSILPSGNGYFRKESGGSLNDAGVVDTSEAQGRLDSYVSPEAEATHSHLLGTDPVLDQNTDFTYGNANAFGGSLKGLATFSSETTVTFNQADIEIELNTAEFNFNNSSKPIPSVAMDPQRKVPILAPFHKVKYIIKAY